MNYVQNRNLPGKLEREKLGLAINRATAARFPRGKAVRFVRALHRDKKVV